MKSELEALLKAFDAFTQAKGPDAANSLVSYDAALDELSDKLKVRREVLDRLVRRAYPRWIRANLPPDFPKHLGLK